VVQGIEQLPIHGSSLVYTFDAPLAPALKRAQYFELMGNRGIWADGWKAVTRHFKGTSFEDDRWELYHLESDFSEADDVSNRYPEKLAELVALWHDEAERNDVFPLDDRAGERGLFTYWGAPRQRWVFEQGMSRVSGYVAPAVGNRSYRIAANVELAPDTQGVILAVGGRAGGYVLFVQNGRLVHEYAGPDRRWVVESSSPLPQGRHELAFEFRKSAAAAGTATLTCDGRAIGSLDMSDMWPLSPTAGGVYCGYDDGSPCSERYALPFSFTATIHSVVVVAGADALVNRSLESHASLSGD
jgi:arylsulfatase